MSKNIVPLKKRKRKEKERKGKGQETKILDYF